MLFSSLTFLFVFLPVVFVLYYIPVFEKRETENKKKNLILLAASLLFYAWGEPVYIVLMLISIYFNFTIGKDIEKNHLYIGKRKRLLIFAVLFNIGVLGFFKYSGFLVENINSLFSLELSYKALPLPIGISFYTFQALSYVIDVYRRDTESQNSLTDFALYISMFPQLIAGPIVQYSDIDTQLHEREYDKKKFSIGILFFIRGLGKKVIFANTAGAVFTEISGLEISGISVLTSWIGIIAYTLQIYFDFSGYSDMAIGLGKMFGFDLIQNFNFPYTAESITDFWRRWHISLSSWFRDYVYIPLGGNRKGVKRQIINLSVVWLLTGLWHGASWNFVVWGVYYGLLLIIEKFILAPVLEKIPRFIKHIGTLVLVIIGWVFFSFEDLGAAFEFLRTMFGFGGALIDDGGKYYLSSYLIPLVIMALSAFGAYRDMPTVKNKALRFFLQSVIYIIVFILSVVFLVSDSYNPFLYFRF